MAEGNEAPAFFLDCLPKDTLNSVLRFFSRLPNAKKWETHIDLSDLLELFAVRGELGSFMKSRFTTLCVCKTRNCFTEYYYLDWKSRTEPHLWTDSLEIALLFVVAGGGESLHTLVVGEAMYQKERHGDNIVDKFLEHCPNVVSLSIMEHGELSWLNKFGGQLENLELMTNIPMDFRASSSALRELTLYTFSGSLSSPDLWRTIGSGLERLNLHGNFFPALDAVGEVEKIKQYCRNLTSISMLGQSDDETVAIASLLTSYGEQLKYADIVEMSEGQIQDVADACPHARFHLRDYKRGASLLPGLNILGPRLEAISTHGFKHDEDSAEWTEAWGKCMNLQELRIQRAIFENVPFMFSSPNAPLKVVELTLHDETDSKDVKKVMDLCAAGTKCVENFIYNGPPLCRDSSRKFLLANRSSLSSIVFGSVSSARGKKLDEFLHSLLELPVFQELVYNCEISEDMLRTLEKHGVYWKRSAH